VYSIQNGEKYEGHIRNSKREITALAFANYVRCDAQGSLPSHVIPCTCTLS